MKPAIYSRDEVLIQPVPTGPCISLILPFEPKMGSKALLQQRLQRSLKTVEKELLKAYPPFTAEVIIKKLNTLIGTLDFATYKKSIAIFVSSDIERVYYLDFQVEEKVIVDQSFEIRDIILNKQMNRQYLLLLLGSDKARIFLCEGEHLDLILENNIDRIRQQENSSEKVSNFTDPGSFREVLDRKFYRYIDNGLSILIKAYPVPLMVAGTKKTRAHFIEMSRNKQSIVELINGNYVDATQADVLKMLEPYLNDWQKIREKDLMLQLDRAMSSRKCVSGIRNVHKAASKGNARLLLVEKDYIYPAFIAPHNELKIVKNAEAGNAMYVKDAVDDIIEKVLDHGGDVEFVSTGLLSDYMHIALVTYY